MLLLFVAISVAKAGAPRSSMQYRMLLPVLLLSGGALVVEAAKPRLAGEIAGLVMAIGGWMILTLGLLACDWRTHAGDQSRPLWLSWLYVSDESGGRLGQKTAIYAYRTDGM